MSGYTIGEIAIWLVLAAVLGFALGWLVRELQVRAGRTPAVSTAPVATPVVEPIPEPVVKSAEAPVVQPVEVPEPVAAPAPPLIKGKKSSMIYHAPSSGAYARTKADVWFHTEDEAVAAGYRKPKNG